MQNLFLENRKFLEKILVSWSNKVRLFLSVCAQWELAVPITCFTNMQLSKQIIHLNSFTMSVFATQIVLLFILLLLLLPPGAQRTLMSPFSGRDSFSAKCANDGFGDTGQLVGREGGERSLQFSQFQHFFLNLCMLFL